MTKISLTFIIVVLLAIMMMTNTFRAEARTNTASQYDVVLNEFTMLEQQQLTHYLRVFTGFESLDTHSKSLSETLIKYTTRASSGLLLNNIERSLIEIGIVANLEFQQNTLNITVVERIDNQRLLFREW